MRVQKQLEFVGEAEGEAGIFDPAVPAGEWAGTIFLLDDFDAGGAVEHPGVELVGPTGVGLVGEDAVDCY